ncbi:MAG TPA: peptidylprolyl isomerase [Burkholderiales bacterium]|nr:peptidylprolyl isomerase [Burkholderiales bacterium]
MVGVRVALADAQGAELSPPAELSYLHGGYGEMLPALEQALEGKGAGESVGVQLEPEQAFGEYDPQLLRVEPLGRYGEGVTVGMQIEEDSRLYTVTDIAGGSVVLDANHPLAGMALRFSVVILTVRSATREEMQRGVSLPQG